MARARKITQRGLGDAGEATAAKADGPKHTCPPPSGQPKKRSASRMLSRSTVRRHGSSLSAVDTDDLAVAVARPTPSSRPRAARGPDVAKAPLEPREAFVLSLVDGSMTAAEIADVSGMPQADVIKMLQKLQSLKLVAIS